MENYLDINRKSWNNRVDAHLLSEFYDLPSFKNGVNSLNEIELKLLGDLEGKSVLHLQCHFGQDTISLSRLGAKALGVDLSDMAIEKGKELALELGVDTAFVCSDIYDLPRHLDQKFDIVFTSYGTIGWLPDLDKWASIIKRFLNPGGQFVFVEFHPFIWMYDDDFEKIKYRYFNDGPITETEEGTYADKSAAISQDYVMWNHSLSEVMTSLLKAGLQIQGFEEYDYSPYNCFNKTVAIASKKYRIAQWDNKIPMVYAIIAKN